jgi:hypothetical protein
MRGQLVGYHNFASLEAQGLTTFADPIEYNYPHELDVSAIMWYSEYTGKRHAEASAFEGSLIGMTIDQAKLEAIRTGFTIEIYEESRWPVIRHQGYCFETLTVLTSDGCITKIPGWG